MPCLQQFLSAAPRTTYLSHHLPWCGLNICKASLLLLSQAASHCPKVMLDSSFSSSLPGCVVPGPAALSSPRNFCEMQKLRLHPRPTASKGESRRSMELCFKKAPGALDVKACGTLPYMARDCRTDLRTPHTYATAFCLPLTNSLLSTLFPQPLYSKTSASSSAKLIQCLVVCLLLQILFI